MKILLFLLTVFLFILSDSFASAKNQVCPPSQPELSFFLRADQKAAMSQKRNGKRLAGQVKNSNASANTEVVRSWIPDQTRKVTDLKTVSFKITGAIKNN